jgi:hypothetical protein
MRQKARKARGRGLSRGRLVEARGSGEAMFDFIASHGVALILIVLALCAAILASARWESTSLWLMSTWHSLPLLGGIAWLARRHQGGLRSASESPAVRSLCGSYAKFIRVLSRSDYDNYMNYLRKAGDLGRTPFPPYLRVVIFTMILLEAAGLAYVLAGWTLPGASEFAQRVAALGIGFLIAVILVFFTHWAGLEIDQSNRYRLDRREWIEAGRHGPLYGPDLSLNDDQRVDDREPAFRQRATRGHGKSSYLLTTITMIMVLVVGSGAAFVRGQVLEQEIVSDTANRARAMQRFGLVGPEANSAAAVADQRLTQQEISIKRRGGWGTLMILVVIFFFLQVLGMFFGYRHAFNGRLSRDAYRAMMADRFSSYNELLHYYDRVADLAQGKLDRLYQLLELKQREPLLDEPSPPRYTFRDYLQQRELQRRDKPLGGTPDGGSGRARPTLDPRKSNGRLFARPSMAYERSTVAAEEQPADRAQAAAEESPAPPIAAGALGSSDRAQLEQAERLERQRAAQRAARNRPGSSGKGIERSESETR